MNKLTIQLIEPSAHLRLSDHDEVSAQCEQSYYALIQEFEEHQEALIPFPLKFQADNFAALLEMFHNQSIGKDIKPGFVSHSTYFLVDQQYNVLGVSNLRHKLTDSLRNEGGHIGYGVAPSQRRKGYATLLLQETLKYAAQRGIHRTLLTCDKSNTASAASS